jgi:hypothetical protein
VEFVLGWDERGRPNWAFRPDFFLPDHGQFLELTTLRQDLVTPKNRKLRRLTELYPDVNVRILYRRDYANLLLKARLAGSVRDVARPADAPPRVRSRRSA